MFSSIRARLFPNIIYVKSRGMLFLKPVTYSFEELLFGLYIYRLPFQSRGKTIGFVDWKLHLTYGEIINLSISDPHRNKGYGRWLLNYAIDSIIKHDLNCIVLNVEKTNINAINFYKKEGFEFIENHKFITHYTHYPLMAKYIK
jgi:ribosomal protein S18 acetylase RimI-like enzyme